MSYRVPAGTDVMLSPYLIQRHPAWWPEPEAYRPERFLPEAEAAREKRVYIPFAAGPRHCVGENFALYEMTVHVARMARRVPSITAPMFCPGCFRSLVNSWKPDSNKRSMVPAESRDFAAR